MAAFRCSFCDKSQYEVFQLIAGPKAYICDECIDVCVEIVTEAKQRPGEIEYRSCVCAPREVQHHPV